MRREGGGRITHYYILDKNVALKLEIHAFFIIRVQFFARASIFLIFLENSALYILSIFLNS